MATASVWVDIPTQSLRATLPIRTKSEQNCRDHWRVVSKRKREHHAITAAVLAGVSPLARDWLKSMRRPLRITLTRLGPVACDSDGATSGSKFLRDEIARWLQIDDGDDAAAIWDNAREVAPCYGVRVRIESAATTAARAMSAGESRGA